MTIDELIKKLEESKVVFSNEIGPTRAGNVVVHFNLREPVFGEDIIIISDLRNGFCEIQDIYA